MRFDAIAYHGFPGGRPAWPFDRVEAPKPGPMTVPATRHGVTILRLVVDGADTQRAIAHKLGMQRVDSVAGPVAALDRAGYIRRTRNDGRSNRTISLTDKGRAALELANA